MTAIKIQKLNFSYSDGHTALENIHLEINEREKVGIIGPNGAGKSTLFLHFNGILPPAKIKEPSIHVGGIPLTTNNLLKIRKMVGLLFQDPDDQIFCPTVWEDVAFGPSQQELTKTEINSCVNNALQEVGLAGFEKRAPHHLSGGEKRRVCLAGVLACQADILVLDEPTSNLDPRGRRELITLLGKLKKTQIIASHDLEFIVQTCDTVILMDKGKIITQGNTKDILSNEQLMLAHGLETPHILRHNHPH